MTDMFAAGPATAVASKLVGGRPATCAVTRCGPAVVPSVQVASAVPSAAVLLLGGVTLPPPDWTDQATAMLPTDRPSASTIFTLKDVGRLVPTVPV
jgi:hypothetical protein